MNEQLHFLTISQLPNEADLNKKLNQNLRSKYALAVCNDNLSSIMHAVDSNVQMKMIFDSVSLLVQFATSILKIMKFKGVQNTAS